MLNCSGYIGTDCRTDFFVTDPLSPLYLVADKYFQCLVCQATAGSTIRIPKGLYYLDGLDPPPDTTEPTFRQILIDKSLEIDFQGSTVVFRPKTGGDLWEKGFKVIPSGTTEYETVVFRNGVFVGEAVDETIAWRNNYRPVITSVSGVRIDRFEISSCVFRNLTAGVNFNAYASGWIRQAVLSNCLFDRIVVNPVLTNDNNRGRGATFSMYFNKSIQSNATSIGNVFRECQRHGIYCFSGGPFLSDGDSFFNCSLKNQTIAPVAAIALKGGTGGDVPSGTQAVQGGSHMRVTNAYFEGCNDGIDLSRAKPAPSAIEEFYDVTIAGCTFVDTVNRDIVLNTGVPDVNGRWANVLVEGTRHFNHSYPNDINPPPPNPIVSQRPIVILDFSSCVIRNVEMRITDTKVNNLAPFNGILVYGNGTANPSDQLLIDGVTATFSPVPAAGARVVQLGSTATSPQDGPEIIIRDVSATTGADLVSPASGWTNDNIHVNLDPAFNP